MVECGLEGPLVDCEESVEGVVIAFPISIVDTEWTRLWLSRDGNSGRGWLTSRRWCVLRL